MSGALARIIDRRISERIERPDACELGVYQADGSIKIDRYRIPIPAGEYLVCRGISPALVAGDRVLAVWVNGGRDLVVVDVVS